MKTYRFNLRNLVTIGVTSLAVATMFSGCGKESKGNLQYVRTEFGGCNIEQPDLMRGDFIMQNGSTVTITISDDSVSVFVSLLYDCKKEPFETRSDVIDDVMFLYIIDLCDPNSNCYARCGCDYTFDFIFAHNGTINQKYKIFLIDPREESPIIISEGTIKN